MTLFPSNTVDILRIDCVFPAGTAFQPHPLVANACVNLLCEGTRRHSAMEVAEFFDFRGIAVDADCSIYHASLTCYVLRKYADEFLPLLHELLTQPAFGEEEFAVYRDKRRQQLLVNQQKTSVVARNQFYMSLFGPEHPLGPSATLEDVDKLTLEEVRCFYAEHYRLQEACFFVAGHYDNAWQQRFESLFGPDRQQPLPLPPAAPILPFDSPVRCVVPNAVQSTIRVGCRLPFAAMDADYHRFMVLNTVLGGYFGSRLMSNIREDKGYTYGIYSRTIIFGSDIVFTITADVAAEHTEAAVREVFVELDRLCREPVSDEELAVVRQYMEGDYLRSIDGIFERVERHLGLVHNGVGEEFTDLFLSTIRTVTPAELQTVAQRIFNRERILTVTAGPEKRD